MTIENTAAPAGAAAATSVENTTHAPAGTAAPVVATPPTSATATPVAEPTAPPATDPAWLKQRLERERAVGAKKALEAVGFASEAEAKTAATAARAAAEANKSAETRAAELSAKLTASTASNERLTAVTTEHAARMMIGLTAEQQTAVKQLAGDDPAQQLSTINALTPTWANAAKVAGDAAAQAAAVAAAAAKSATTAPPAGAPNGAAPPVPTARATYDSLRTSNPFAAAKFGLSNPEAYSPKS